MICVLDVTAGPAQGRRFWIRSDEKLEIGRISTADFSVPTDKQMSRHHLILEGSADRFRIRDVGSANGTFVNHSRVTTIELCDGDLVKAGQTIFRVSVLADDHSSNLLDTPVGSPKLDRDDDTCDSVQPDSEPAASAAALIDLDAIAFPPQHDPTRRIRHPLHEDEAEVCGAPSFWGELHFQATKDQEFFLQPLGADRECSISFVLKRVRSEFHVATIINAPKLRRFEKQLLENLATEAAVTAETSQACSIVDHWSQQFFMLAESLVARDAVFFLGSEKPIQPSLVTDLCLACRQSEEVDQLLKREESDLGGHLRHSLAFLLYEYGAQHQLKLWIPAT